MYYNVYAVEKLRRILDQSGVLSDKFKTLIVGYALEAFREGEEGAKVSLDERVAEAMKKIKELPF